MWIRVFPHTPVTARPADTRMGKGKGNVDYWCAKVDAGTIIFELAGVSEDMAREAVPSSSAHNCLCVAAWLSEEITCETPPKTRIAQQVRLKSCADNYRQARRTVQRSFVPGHRR